MEINAIDAVSSANSAQQASSVTSAKAELNAQFGSRLDNENMFKRQQTKEFAEDFLKKYKDKIEVHNDWYHVFVGDDYITLEGDGKLTFKELRENLGIPPTVLSKTNNKKFKDKDVIDGKIEIKLEDIGWFARSIDEMEAQDVRSQRSHGDPYAGYSRAVSDGEIFEWLGR
ncbi:MAG: hypothetical protein VZR09_00935 [Candidatus Gastranaerophilaceae bacterium]|jgi:hypothetical protein|nr:hypothetical protein [Candidatus Gastranaerophilaceae bacterium]